MIRLVIPLLLLTASLAAQEIIRTGRTMFRGVVVSYQVIGDRAIFDGDIDLGPADLLEGTDDIGKNLLPKSVYLASPLGRWPNGVIPYVVDEDMPNEQRILNAVNQWNTLTPIRLQPRSGEVNYVRFIRQQNSGTCFSSIGMVGGPQLIRVDDLCNANGLAHEIGHAVGLYHEQSRADRDYYLAVNLANVDKRRYADLSRRPSAAADGGPFDFGSIMEYSRYSASLRRILPTIETIPAGMPIDGSGHGLSAGDIDRVVRMYSTAPRATTVTTNPEGLRVVVDGETFTAPRSFEWAPGSVHTLDVPDGQGDGNPTRYLFGRWSDNANKQHSITVSPETTVYAASFIRQFLVRTGVNPAGGGLVTITPASRDGYYAEGTLLSIRATTGSDFSFSGWDGPGSTIFIGLDGFANPTTTIRATSANLAYIAHFTRSPFLTIATDPPNLPVTVNGSRASGPRTVVNPGASVSVSADAMISFSTSVTRYVFAGWSDGGEAAHNINPPLVGPMPTITAQYKVQHLVTTAFSGSGTVAVTPASPDGYYDSGTTIEITAAPAAGFQLSGWSGDLSGTALSQRLTVNDQVYVQASFLRPFAIAPLGIVNAANYLYTPVSPGEILTIFGLAIGPQNAPPATLDASGRLATTLASLRVLFDGVAAPIWYALPNQLAVIAPYSLAGRTTTRVEVELNSARTPAVTLPVSSTAPGMFTLDGSGVGQAIIQNQDYKLNTRDNPAEKGSVVILYVTGEGQTNPNGVDGKLANDAILPAPRVAPTVLIGGPPGVGVNAPVFYAGAAPSLVAGVMQMNVMIPLDAPSGDVPISFSIGGVSSPQMTTVAIR